MNKVFICSLNDIPDGGSKGIQLQTAQRSYAMILVRLGEQCHAYENRCPHLGLPLEWQPDQFLSDDGSMIQCRSHGALFTLEQGLCVSGPCSGNHLTSITIELNQRNIYLNETPPP